MFTGIVQGVATVTDVVQKDHGFEIELELGSLREGLMAGASVSCAGACLTAIGVVGSRARFFAMQETLERTTLGSLQVGGRLNVERAARIGDEIGGHLVSGHVMGVATILGVDTSSGDWVVTLQGQPEWMPYLFAKGFVALDGCSLTLVRVQDDIFTVHLIPETLARTTFSAKQTSDRVNVEIDVMTQAVVDTVRRMRLHET